jgi:segregation and condensation protein B
MTLETTEQKDDLRGAVEAILMITDSPISLVALATALEQPVNLVRDLVLSISEEYSSSRL